MLPRDYARPVLDKRRLGQLIDLVGLTVDQAMAAIERDNPALKDVLPRDYARPVLDKRRLGQLIDLVSNIQVGNEDARSRDMLGRVYEYFLSQFASAEGKKGDEFYTPRCVVKVLVARLSVARARLMRLYLTPLDDANDSPDAAG